MRAFLIATLLGLFVTSAQAHTPLFDCFDNGDDTITCEGGFSDGASGEGVTVKVLNAQGKVLEQAVMGEEGSVGFKRPSVEFSVVFEAGASHSITVFGDDIY
jgi:hypothetical protein